MRAEMKSLKPFRFQDSHTLNFSSVVIRGTNITTMRLVDPNTIHVRNVVSDWEVGEGNHGRRIHTVQGLVRVSGNR